MRMLLASLVLVALASMAKAQEPKIERVEIVEAGIFQAEAIRREAAPGTIKGSTAVVSNIQLQQATARIPARIGVQFGVRFRIVGTPDGGRTTIRIVKKFPQPIRDPKSGKTSTSNEQLRAETIGEVRYTGLTFEYDEDLVPGTWTFEFWVGERRMAAKDFEVFKP